MLYRRLSGTDLDLSVVGFGAAPLGEEYGPVDERESTDVVRAALDEGINYFDTSPYYGRTLSESRLGLALSGFRDQAIISTKAGRYDRHYPEGFDFSYRRIVRSIDQSLRRLRTDHVDIVFLHDIEFSPASMILDEGLPALVDAREAGKVRFLGVSGYPLDVLIEIVETGSIDVVLSYCHGDLLNSSVTDCLVPVARDNQCGVITASPLHMGLLSPSGPPSWHPAGPELRRAARALIDYCKKKGVSLPAAALSYALGLDGPASVLIGIGNARELSECVSAARQPVEDRTMATLVTLRGRFGGEPWPSGIR
ncbi:MAG: aldo/keto reductase [bacterium]|nr:aldo/keto reductase [Acidimicrobiia bacterium]MCY4649289.1 aldo/keto reductase [bacterium]